MKLVRELLLLFNYQYSHLKISLSILLGGHDAMNISFIELFEKSDDGIAIITVERDEKNSVINLLISEVNEALENIVNKNKSKIVGERLFDVFPDKHEEWFKFFLYTNEMCSVKKVVSYIPLCSKDFLIKVMYINKSTYIISFIDIPSYIVYEKKLIDETNKLEETTKKLEVTEQKLVEEDKLASIGQLAAGVAHEINNPLGFVLSNFETLKKYMTKFKSTLLSYREFKNSVVSSTTNEIDNEIIKSIGDDKSLDFIMEDLNELFLDTEDGLERVRKIVIALRSFSRQEQDGVFEEYDLNSGMETALLIARNEVKYNAEIEKDFGKLPLIQANSGQINQVLLNVVVNASHAIKEKNTDKMGVIKIKTYYDKEYVYCSIEDNGVGISEENLISVFNPFFTTKPLGIGTGLGLSISYDIIKNKHNGDIEIESKKNHYTIITIKLPITQQGG